MRSLLATAFILLSTTSVWATLPIANLEDLKCQLVVENVSGKKKLPLEITNQTESSIEFYIESENGDYKAAAFAEQTETGLTLKGELTDTKTGKTNSGKREFTEAYVATGSPAKLVKTRPVVEIASVSCSAVQ